MNLAIVFGGTSREREVSINSGKCVLNALKSEEHIYPLDFNGDYDFLLEKIQSKNIDLVFNALHGGDGEDGTFQLFLENNNILYTGSNSKSSKIAMNKNATKRICLQNGMPTPKWYYFNSQNATQIDFDILLDEFSKGCVIKPCKEGSSIGMHILKSDEINKIKLENSINKVFEISNEVIVEEYVMGRELTVGILDKKALPVVEIFPKSSFYDYSSKYKKGNCEYLVPAKLTQNDEACIKKYAVDLHKLVGCDSYSRVDFLMDKNSNIFALEINTLPGLTDTSLLPKATKSIGMSYRETIYKIIDLSYKK